MLKQWKDIFFILMAAIVCHYLFSQFGFNPTDEGFVLSSSNRVLHGQIPHVDFSSVRPLGYAYLHIPELLLSKDYFFLTSRFVFWLEQLLIAYCWIMLIAGKRKQAFSDVQRYTYTLVVFVFNVHYFPCSVLHTIDGLLLCVAGILFLNRKQAKIGFLLLGVAALCKQNYLAVLFFALILYRPKNIITYLLVGLLPIVIYTGYVSFHGGWVDMTTQLSAQHGLLQAGLLSFLTNPLLYAGIALAFIFLQKRLPDSLIAFILLLFAMYCLFSNHYHGKYMFLLIGVLLGDIAYKYFNKETIETELTALLLSWSVSISVGYNTPALFSGGILILYIIKALDTIPATLKTSGSFVLLFIACISLFVVRTSSIYRDAPANQLIFPLDNIVEGAHGIYTNENTFNVLQELDSLKHAHTNLIVVPDFTATNILHAHLSNIATEWPNKTEIPNENILHKVIKDVAINDSTVVVIPVFQTALLSDGFTPMYQQGNDYPIIRYMRANFHKKQYTRYFELRTK